MSNEWNNLSESLTKHKRRIASIKVKRKSPIYKHIVIRKKSSGQQSPSQDIEINDEFSIMPQSKIQQPQSFSLKPDENKISLSSIRTSSKLMSNSSNLRQSSYEINFLRGKYDLPSFMMNLTMKVGKKVNEDRKVEVLKIIARKALGFECHKATLRCYFNDSEKCFNVVCFGSQAPVSDCCNVNMIVQASKEFGGRIVCTDRKCIIKYISNFGVTKEHLEILFESKEVRPNSHSQQRKCRTNESIQNPSMYIRQEFLALNSKTIAAPRDTFSAYIDPLQQILKAHKKLRYS